MFSFFFRKKAIQRRFDFIGADMHNHLLPGLDDGCPDVNTSISLLNGLLELGFSSITSTPHIISDLYPNSLSTISSAYQQYQQAINDVGLNVPTNFAAEYMLNFDFDEILEKKEVLTFGTEKYLLLEMSYAVKSPNLKEAVFNALINGYTPILAHPERYNYMHHSFADYETLVDSGCELQLNLLSVLGYYGPQVKAIAIKLIQHKLVSWLGTDLHHDRHLEALQALSQNTKALKLLESIDKLQNRKLL